MEPSLLDIVTFGILFVVMASLAQGMAMPMAAIRQGLGAHSQLDVMAVPAAQTAAQPRAAAPAASAP